MNADFYTPETMKILRFVIAVADLAMQIVKGDIQETTQEGAMERMRSITFMHGMDERSDQNLVLALTEMVISTIVSHVSPEEVEGMNTELLSMLPGLSEARN